MYLTLFPMRCHGGPKPFRLQAPSVSISTPKRRATLAESSSGCNNEQLMLPVQQPRNG